MNPAIRTSLSVLATAACLSAIAGLQYATDQAGAPLKSQLRLTRLVTSEPLLPSSATIRLLSLNSPQVVADILWVQTIQYFGMGNPYGDYPSLGKITNTIADLDPRFARPYEFGMVTLPYMKQLPATVALAAKSEKGVPFGQRGLLDFMHGTIHLLNTKNYPEAARLYELAAKQPDHPQAAERLSAIALNKISGEDSRAIAIEYWTSLAERETDEQTKDTYVRWAAHMHIVDTLEKLAKKYEQEKGSYPKTLNDLVTAGYIAFIPESPVGRLLVLDPTTKQITFDQLDPSKQ